jgi:hypothetical protein
MQLLTSTLEAECAKLDTANDPLITSTYGRPEQLLMSQATSHGLLKQEDLTFDMKKGQ